MRQVLPGFVAKRCPALLSHGATLGVEVNGIRDCADIQPALDAASGPNAVLDHPGDCLDAERMRSKGKDMMARGEVGKEGSDWAM